MQALISVQDVCGYMLASEYPQANLFEEDWNFLQSDDGDLLKASVVIDGDKWKVVRDSDENGESLIRVIKTGMTQRKYTPTGLSSSETANHACQRAMWREIRRIGYENTHTCKYCPVPVTSSVGYGSDIVTDALGKTVHTCMMCIREEEYEKHGDKEKYDE